MKTHKLPRIARLQLDAGARGLTCQKLGEAELMADAGFDDILITFPLIGTGKAERLAELAARANVTVGADSAAVARGLSRALEERGTEIGFLVDCDTGFARTGVQSPAEAADLAELVERLPGLRFAGLMTHPATRGERAAAGRGARGDRAPRPRGRAASAAAARPARCRVHESGVFTELRVGTYVYGDRRCLALGVTPLEDCALRVVATVVSRPTRDHAVLDAGSKTLTSDTLPGLEAGTFGLVVEYPDARDPRGCPRSTPTSTSRPATGSPRSARWSRSSRTTPAARSTCTTASRCTAAAATSRSSPSRAAASFARQHLEERQGETPPPGICSRLRRALGRGGGDVPSPRGRREREQRVVVPVGHALLQRDDRVVGDLDPLRADLGAALRDVAERDARLVLHEVGAVGGVERVHLERGDADEEARAEVAALQVVVAQDVADVLAEEALDALAELRDAVDVLLLHAPVGVRLRRNGGMRLFTS